MSTRDAELLKESLINIKESMDEKFTAIKTDLDEIADVLFKGNGHSLLTRTSVLEEKVEGMAEDVSSLRKSMHDMKNFVTANTLKIDRMERREQEGSGKHWDLVKIALTAVVSITATVIIQHFILR